jgi:hypothetical protein
MNLVQLEEDTINFVSEIPDASSNEKAKRVRLVLDFILEYYTKHLVSLDVKEAYKILFGEGDE